MWQKDAFSDDAWRCRVSQTQWHWMAKCFRHQWIGPILQLPGTSFPRPPTGVLSLDPDSVAIRWGESLKIWAISAFVNIQSICKQSKPVAPHYDLIRAAGSRQYGPFRYFHCLLVGGFYFWSRVSTAMLTRDIDIAIMLSIRLSVTFRYCTETA